MITNFALTNFLLLVIFLKNCPAQNDERRKSFRVGSCYDIVKLFHENRVLLGLILQKNPATTNITRLAFHELMSG